MRHFFVFCFLAAAVVLCSIAANKADSLTLEERQRLIAETKCIVFSNGARLKVEYKEGSKDVKESPAFMLHLDADGKSVVYPVDMEYYTKKFGGVDVEGSSEKYLAEAARRTKKTYGFTLLRDMYFGDDDELLPTYKMMISKCRAALSSENGSRSTEKELDYRARNIAEWILYDTNGKVTTEMVRNIKVYVKRAIAAQKKEDEKRAAAVRSRIK